MARTCPVPPVMPPELPGGPAEMGRSAYVITHCAEELLRARRYKYVTAKALVSVLPAHWPDGVPVHLVLRDPHSAQRFGVFRPSSHGGLQCTGCGARCNQLGDALSHVVGAGSGAGKRWLLANVHGIGHDIMTLSARVQDLVQDEYLWQAGASRPVIAGTSNNNTPAPAPAPAPAPRPPLPLNVRVLKIQKAMLDIQRARDEAARAGIIAVPEAVASEPVRMSQLVESLCQERAHQYHPAFLDHLGRTVSVCPVRAAVASAMISSQ